jgi:hypothetical protein
MRCISQRESGEKPRDLDNSFHPSPKSLSISVRIRVVIAVGRTNGRAIGGGIGCGTNGHGTGTGCRTRRRADGAGWQAPSARRRDLRKGQGIIMRRLQTVQISSDSQKVSLSTDERLRNKRIGNRRMSNSELRARRRRQDGCRSHGSKTRM